MNVNKYIINTATLTGVTATTINIPINMVFQVVDQGELIDTVFVDVEKENAVNPIVDYEKVRFIPVNGAGKIIDKVIYTVDLSGATNYADIGFTDEDIALEKENFKQTFLTLSFYDSDNPLTQNLIAFITLYSEIKLIDLFPLGSTSGVPGQPKPANQIPITYVLENPSLNTRTFSEGYYLYDFKDELKIGDFKYIYMRARFNNAKTGKSVNMMVKNIALPIDELVHELYTRYKLIRTTTGYYYKIDETYQGNVINMGLANNVTYSTNLNEETVTTNLFEIRAV